MIKDASTVAIERSEYDSLNGKITELEALVKYCEEQFRLAKHRQFGASSEKSEYDGGQLNFFNEVEAIAGANEVEPELVEVEKHFRKRQRLTNDRLPDDLPVEMRTCVQKYE